MGVPPRRCRVGTLPARPPQIVMAGLGPRLSGLDFCARAPIHDRPQHHHRSSWPGRPKAETRPSTPCAGERQSWMAVTSTAMTLQGCRAFTISQPITVNRTAVGMARRSTSSGAIKIGVDASRGFFETAGGSRNFVPARARIKSGQDDRSLLKCLDGAFDVLREHVAPRLLVHLGLEGVLVLQRVRTLGGGAGADFVEQALQVRQLLPGIAA